MVLVFRCSRKVEQQDDHIGDTAATLAQVLEKRRFIAVCHRCARVHSQIFPERRREQGTQSRL